jgi:peptidoglycan/xylan/chitin deacetylase (PgdA/CDA1 family)
LAARLTGFTKLPDRGPSLRILTYHRVNATHPDDRLSVHPKAFESQMQFLAEHVHVLSFPDALDGLRGRRTFEDPAVVVTFDDGYGDNYDVALPILGRFGIPATFFLITRHIGSTITIERYENCCDMDQNLNWDEVRELLAGGHTIGGHGRTHRELGLLTVNEVMEEVAGCREDIERETGDRPLLFCYPRGSETPEVRRLVASAGYEAACTVYPGGNTQGGDLFALRRTEISGGDDLEDFRRKLSGGFDRWHQLVQSVEHWRYR